MPRETAYLLVIFAALTGCQTIISEEEAVKYASFSPREFIKKRFYDDEQIPGVSAITSSLSKIQNFIGEPARPKRSGVFPQIRADGETVEWTAFYNNVNYVQLLKPSAELRRLCKAQGKSINIAEKYQIHRLEKFMLSPHMQGINAQRRRQAEVARKYSNSNTSALVAAHALSEQEAERSFMSSAGYFPEGLRYAIRLGAFDRFFCVGKTETDSWTVSIEPLSMQPNNGTGAAQLSMALSARADFRSTQLDPTKFLIHGGERSEH